jgi:hypothetical protein
VSITGRADRQDFDATDRTKFAERQDMRDEVM